MRFDKFCQSCMLPKKHDLFELGTEKDGSNNNDYCKLCYVEGEFTQLEIKSGKTDARICKGSFKRTGNRKGKTVVLYLLYSSVKKVEEKKMLLIKKAEQLLGFSFIYLKGIS